MSKYLIKVSGVPSSEGAGEYDGGDTLAAAKRRAREEFAPHVPHGDIAIYTVTRDGGLRWAADVQSWPMGGRPESARSDVTLGGRPAGPVVRRDPASRGTSPASRGTSPASRRTGRSRTLRARPAAGGRTDVGPKPTRRQQEFIQEKIRTLRHEGYPQRQAIAIAHSMAGVAKRNPAARRDVPPRPGDARSGRDRSYTKRQFDAETKRNMGRERREYEREVGMLEPGAPHPRGWGESATRYRREERLAIPRSQDIDRLALRRPGGEHLQRLAGIERLRGAGWYLPIGRREQDKALLGPYDSEREARESRARLRRRGEKNVGTPFRRAPARARRDPSSAKTPEGLARHIAREYQQKDLSPFELRQDYRISRPKAHLIWAAAGQRRSERWLEDRVLEVLRQSGARDPAQRGTSRSRRDGAKRSPARVKRGAG